MAHSRSSHLSSRQSKLQQSDCHRPKSTTDCINICLYHLLRKELRDVRRRLGLGRAGGCFGLGTSCCRVRRVGADSRIPQLTTTHHNPSQPATTSHKFQKFKLWHPQLTPTHLSQFPLLWPLPKPTTTHSPRCCPCNNLRHLPTTYHSSSQLVTSKIHHNSPQAHTSFGGHDLVLKNHTSFSITSSCGRVV